MATPDTPAFPVRPANRPALDHIRYRLGAYPDVLDAMLRELNASADLARWTHRAPDDPGIALIESAAVVADILTFYQEHYANEAFLRTARWRESVQELVRLTGYRLAPGIGGRATFAVEVKGTAPVAVPAGFPIKADLENVSDPVDFLTTAGHVAHPHLSRFRLYRQRHIITGLYSNTHTFEIFAVGNSQNPAGIEAFDLKKGDKLMIVAPAPAWITSGTAVSDQPAAQIVKVSNVTHLTGRIIVEIEGRIEAYWPGTVRAYRVNRVFRHFGHNTPAKITYQSGSGSSMTTHQTDAHLFRHLKGNCQGTPGHLYTTLPKNVLPLDQEVNDLSLRAGIIVEALLRPTGTATSPRKVFLVRTIRALRSLTMSWGNVSGPSTWIDLGSTAQLVPNSSITGTTADIREFRIHEVTSAQLSLRGIPAPFTGNFTAPNQLYYYGTTAGAQPFVGRRIYLQARDGRFAHASVTALDLAAPGYARMRQVTLDRKPKGFKRQDFDEAAPEVDVFGNIVDVTQGRREAAVPLGNGDARQTFQTFKVPKFPVTYLLDPAATPPHVPELTLRVNGREWRRVDSLFGHGPLEEIYVLREHAGGETYVQFGDGETGARLPSGINNVVVEYRTGHAALGPGKPGARPSAGAQLDHLDKLTLAGEVSGGAPPEDPGKARIAAPGRLQSLGRLVSLRDYETETLQIGGVVTATAAWEVILGVPAIHLCVLLEQAQQSDVQFSAVEAIIRFADQARGPNRHPIKVTQCELRYVYLSVNYSHDPALPEAAVDAALRAALGLAGDEAHERSGLFGLRRRRLGEKEYLTRIEGTLQNVPGIRWCRVEHLGLLPAANDPGTLSVPGAPARNPQVPCTPTELLQLHPLHVTLTPAT
jgi:hypothetical protein